MKIEIPEAHELRLLFELLIRVVIVMNNKNMPSVLKIFFLQLSISHHEIELKYLSFAVSFRPGSDIICSQLELLTIMLKYEEKRPKSQKKSRNNVYYSGSN